MVVELLSGIIVILLCYWSGYTVSRHAVLNRYTLERGQEDKAGEDDRQNKASRDPRLLRQISLLYNSIILVLSSFAAAFLLWNLRTILSVYLVYAAIATMPLVWVGHVFFTEYLPRRLSRSRLPSGGGQVRFANAVIRLLWPLVRFYRHSIRLAGGNGIVTDEEKEEIVERAIETLAEQAGIDEAIIEEDEKEMIGHIFELDQTVVREIMIPRTRITAIELGSPLEEIKALVKKDGYSRFPVYTDTIDSITGILYVKDLFSAHITDGAQFDLGRYLRKPYVVPESKVISELLREFKSQKVHIAIVVDEYGGVAGLVTLEDILEEIVGEIRDEHDIEEDDIKKLANGSYRVNAAMLLEELQEYLNTNYDQGEYDSVGGLIYDLVGSVPRQGTLVQWYDLEFEIAQVHGQRLTGIIVRRHPSSGPDSTSGKPSGA